jgi:hypothetical protein
LTPNGFEEQWPSGGGMALVSAEKRPAKNVCILIMIQAILLLVKGPTHIEKVRVAPYCQEQRLLVFVLPTTKGGWHNVLTPGFSYKTSRTVMKSPKGLFSTLSPAQKASFMGGEPYNPLVEQDGTKVIEGDSYIFTLRDTDAENESGKKVNRVALAMPHAYVYPVILLYRYRCDRCSPGKGYGSKPLLVPQYWIPGIHDQNGDFRTDLVHPVTNRLVSAEEAHTILTNGKGILNLVGLNETIEKRVLALKFLERNQARTLVFDSTKKKPFGPNGGWRYELNTTAPYAFTWIGGTCPVCNF